MRAIWYSILPLSIACASTHAAINLADKNGWRLDLSASLPVFASLINGTSETGFRITSGFNPANITFQSKTPSVNEWEVSSTVQLNQHLQGSTQNSGLFESRVTEIHLQHNSTTWHIGKGFGIFNSLAIGDSGSSKGIGWLGSESDTANATGGHIGTGYVYANFNPRVIYESRFNESGHVKVGIFNPEEPTDATGTVETKMPRIEGQLDWTIHQHIFWAGFLYQSVDLVGESVDYTMHGLDVGAQIIIDNTTLRGAYTITEGIGADGLYGGTKLDADVEGNQWYLEGTFKQGQSIYGISHGVGTQDAHTSPYAVPKIENSLTMLFMQQTVTPQLTIMLEIQKYLSESNGISTSDYQAVSVGMQFDI